MGGLSLRVSAVLTCHIRVYKEELPSVELTSIRLSVPAVGRIVSSYVATAITARCGAPVEKKGGARRRNSKHEGIFFMKVWIQK